MVTVKACAIFSMGLCGAWFVMGCGGETTDGPGAPGDATEIADTGQGEALANALRQRFPDRAAQVLEQGEAFVATEEGFRLDESSARGAWQGVGTLLPRDCSDPIRLRGFGGTFVEVGEIGCEGEGTTAEGAVAYRRTGGTSFWTAIPGGIEEWLHLDADAVRKDEPATAWQVVGASVRQRGDGVEIVDADGVVRLAVTAPVAYAQGGREVKVWLKGSGATIELHVDAAGEAMLIDPLWTAIPSMVSMRTDHTATLLQNGKVLVAAGYGYASAELYDPLMNTWSSAGSMQGGRSGHAATLLSSGKVLITGGTSGSPITSAVLYDPAANTWSVAAPMAAARQNHTATLLPNGKVLVGGGGGTTAELYDPTTNTWASAGTMIDARFLHTATLLPNGKVLMAGGFIASAELYDTATGTWSPTGPMMTSRARGIAALLPNGKVLVSGGVSANVVGTAELYDPAAGTWTPTSSMSVARSAHIGVLLPNGKVLVSGSYTNGNSLSSAEAYDPATGMWSPANAMVQPRARHTATLLPNGDVMVAGGQQNQFGTVTASAELYALVGLGAPCGAGTDCLSGFCADGVCCGSACNGGACEACSVAAGAAANGTCSAFTGNACNDGSACTQTDTCQAGVCMGVNAVSCAASDNCHVAGVCDPANGMCTNPSKPGGALCDDGNACTQTDTCQAGVCLGANSVACAAQDSCHIAGACNPATGVCSNPAKADGTACDDTSVCTQGDTCQGGICAGATSVVCPLPKPCHAAGVCNPVTGTCSNPPKVDGSPCGDGDACTQTDMCQAGACVGGDPLVCKPLNSCYVAGTCDSVTGVCTNIPKPDSAACDDGDACTQADTCTASVCEGKVPVVCQPTDECHEAGACDSATGACSTPVKPDGTMCAGGSCNAGICVPASGGAGGGGTAGAGGSGGTADTGGSGGTAGTGGSGGAPVGSGNGGDGGTIGGTTAEESGCGCAVPGSPVTGGLWSGLGLLLAVLFRRAGRGRGRRD